MFSSIKGKLFFITALILVAISLILLFANFENYRQTKKLKLESCDYTVSAFAEKVNQKITKMNDNVIDLALLGEIYYKTGKAKNIADYSVKTIFEDYEDSLGGGIWFEPYAINPSKRLACTYAFRNKENTIVIDRNFESEQYNYLNRSWYKEIKPELLEGKKIVWSEPYHENEGSYALMTTVGAGIYDSGKLIGMSTVDWEISSIAETVSEIKPTPNSFVLFADKNNDYIIVSTDPYLDNSALVGEPFNAIPWYNDELQNGQSFKYHGKKYTAYVKELDNEMLLIVNVPTDELLSFVLIHATILLSMLILISVLFSVLIYFALKKYINTPIEQLMEIANKIGQGDLDAEITIKKPEEFAKLAETFGTMAKDIKENITNIKNITADKERMASELSIAKSIQLSAVPSSFFDEMKEFNIYATMDTAKEVGGDFYDFFFIDNSKFVFLIADVSGKGIPAALFMMTTKTLIKNLAKEGYQPKELFEKINNQIYENNKQGFFVTLFATIIDINTGKATYINCGHNPPLIKKKNGKYGYQKLPANLVLGAMGNTEYKTYETTFEIGDTIFLYTDGVSEAMNKDGNLYGEKQLENCLNNNSDNDINTTIKNIREDVYRHADGAEQSDDITMLIFEYNGKDPNTFVSEAKKENYNSFLAWLEMRCEEKEVPQNIVMKTELVAEELFLNIANYAYAESAEVGTITALFEDDDNRIVLKFIDNGIKYNPLEKTDPDVSLDINERQIGGLGIFMVKNTVDDIQYEYKNNQNILTITINY